MSTPPDRIADQATGPPTPRWFGTSKGAWLLFAAALIAGPCLLFWHLHGLWDPDGSYAYGWVVPFLAAFLFKLRWDDRPAPSVPLQGAIWIAAALALLVPPTRWLQEAAPERAICAWSFALAVAGIALSLMALAGGTSWLRWFSFPLAFILTAVPWPHSMELMLSNSLMHGTAGATVEILCLIGIPALQAGNLVHIETGVIDIDEACSGIRSLQAMVMLSLFLGELFRLKPARRLWLMVAGLAVTILANVIRTVVLASLGAHQGMNAVDRYHDTAGLCVLVVSLSVTLLIAYRLRSSKAPMLAPQSLPLRWALPVPWCTALLVWFLATEIAVETWYQAHEPKWQGWSWAIQWPKQDKQFQFLDIPARSKRLLMCDESQAATWRDADGGFWSLYLIRWNPGNLQAESAKVHRPDVCLNAEGAVMEHDFGTHVSTVGAMPIPFHSYSFRMGEDRLYVFFCLREEQPGEIAGTAIPEFEGTGMFQRALRGRRHVGEQSLEIAMSGYRSEQSAQEAFQARLGQLLKVRADAAARAGR
ncbi:exosortase [Chthoniobacter flavus]|uniref:exosortase/archaeosortase family protein n=1 Tax=Chthoniobacter flavus TaxID=191863 RepID=UPI001043B797|nr:exosortase/archaeosortase family protein [Chthoniobacter flavus]TCO92828.1 exosortase [Chthoniobacter flavus]